MSNNNTNNCSGASISSNTIWYTGTTTGGWSVSYPMIVPEEVAAKKENKDGCNCKKCKEFYPYAEPNQDDGTLVCYSCRHGW